MYASNSIKNYKRRGFGSVLSVMENLNWVSVLENLSGTLDFDDSNPYYSY